MPLSLLSFKKSLAAASPTSLMLASSRMILFLSNSVSLSTNVHLLRPSPSSVNSFRVGHHVDVLVPGWGVKAQVVQKVRDVLQELHHNELDVVVSRQVPLLSVSIQIVYLLEEPSACNRCIMPICRSLLAAIEDIVFHTGGIPQAIGVTATDNE
eukprot:4276351-Amphidinium_carterae.2